MDSFRVFTRCRPLNQNQSNFGAHKKTVAIINEQTLSLSDGNTKQHTFQMDGVFNENANNFEIFQTAIIPLIENVLNGVNSTAFAYGITGAGKSFTMFGKHNRSTQGSCTELSGIIPLTFQYLINLLEEETDTKITISYLEIYNEQVFDLFQSTQQNLQLSEDPVLGVMVQDLTEVEMKSFEETQDLIAVGNSRRVIAETKANEVSSRSHAIVIINIERRVPDTDQFYSAKLSLVDLAGSQKQSVHHETRGIRTFEGSNINKSLLTLGNCINILSDKRKSGQAPQFIPYRDSKLTRLLKDSLGGNTKTVMIACISPSYVCYEETANTLKYACRANKIEKIVHQNIKQTKSSDEYKKQIVLLRKQNDLLKLNLNMSLMMPGLTQGLAEQEANRKKKMVANLLDQLAKAIQERVLLMGCQNEESMTLSVEQVWMKEEQLKAQILNEIEIRQNKNMLKSNVVKPKKSDKFNQKGIQEQTHNKRISTPIKNTQNRLNAALIKKNTIDVCKQPSKGSTYSQYKLSLKNQPGKEYEQGFDQRSQVNSQKQISPLINLENLRKKVMEDKKQFVNFKKDIKEGLLTSLQIQTKAIKLLEMDRSAILSFSDDEKEYLIKLAQGESGEPSRYSTARKNIQKLSNVQNYSNGINCSDFALKIIDNGGLNSRNRHMQRLNKIMSLAKTSQHFNSLICEKDSLQNYNSAQPENCDSRYEYNSDRLSQSYEEIENPVQFYDEDLQYGEEEIF